VELLIQKNFLMKRKIVLSKNTSKSEIIELMKKVRDIVNTIGLKELPHIDYRNTNDPGSKHS
jgi:hypothetical protein